MTLTLPLKTAVGFPRPVAILRHTKLGQEGILHQTTCDFKNRTSLFTSACNHHLGMIGTGGSDHSVHSRIYYRGRQNEIEQLVCKAGSRNTDKMEVLA
jgi:hypothetical protein